MNLATVLKLPIFEGVRVVAGHQRLSGSVKLVGVVDHPQPLPFVKPRQLVLTTGYAWPHDEESQRALVAGLVRRDIAAICMAVPQYFEVLPEPVRDEAGALGLPLLELPWEVPFSQVTLEVGSAIIAEQYETIERAERLHRSLTRAASEASSLADLARVLGSLMHRSVVFEDAAGRLLGSFESGAVESGGVEARVSAEFRRAAVKLGYFERACKQLRALRVPSLPKMATPEMILCPIALKREVIGWVWVVGGSGHLGELEVRATEHAALVAGLYLSHQRKVAQTQAQLGYSFVDSLLQGSDDRVLASDHVHERARLMGFEVSARYRLCVLSLEAPLPLSPEGLLKRERLLGDLRSLLERKGIPPLLSPSMNRVYLLLPESVPTERFWHDLTDDPATQWTRQRGELAFLVGRPHGGTEGVRRSYLELAPLLPHMRLGAVQHFEQTLLLSVLQGDRRAQAALLGAVYGPLEAHPALRATLQALAENGFQQKVSAKTLGVHLNTLRYRLERIETILQLRLDDPEVQFRIQVAARLSLLTHEK